MSHLEYTCGCVAEEFRDAYELVIQFLKCPNKVADKKQ
jgi:hypothetical protein